MSGQTSEVSKIFFRKPWRSNPAGPTQGLRAWYVSPLRGWAALACGAPRGGHKLRGLADCLAAPRGRPARTCGYKRHGGLPLHFPVTGASPRPGMFRPFGAGPRRREVINPPFRSLESFESFESRHRVTGASPRPGMFRPFGAGPRRREVINPPFRSLESFESFESRHRVTGALPRPLCFAPSGLGRGAAR